MRTLILLVGGALLLAIPVTFNACEIMGLPRSPSSSTTIEQRGGTTGNPLVPLRATAYRIERTYNGCFKGLILRRTDGTITLVPIVETPTSIYFSGTEFGSFLFPNGEYDQIRLLFVARCTLNGVADSSFVMENDNGTFVSSDSIVLKFDGHFAYPDPNERSPVLDLTPIVLELESVTSNEEVAPFAIRSNGTFYLE